MLQLFISPFKKKWIVTCFLLAPILSFSQVKILFDNTHAETSGTSADWTIDADLHNMSWSSTGPYTCGSCSHSNPQQIPTPAQNTITTSTAESYWEGALSNWGIDLVNKGYELETLPYTGSITYGNSANPQDLSNYKVFIVPEPNSLFTTAEKNALLQFVQNGGGLFMISDHNGSDRNNDGWDSPHIWLDFTTTFNNPFGITVDTVDISPNVNTVANLPNDSILHGPMGNVTGILYHDGTTWQLDPTANIFATGVLYESGNSGNTGVLVGHSRYGRGKVAVLGDSSPLDDGTGNPASTLYSSYATDVNGAHRVMLVNAVIWLAAEDSANAAGTLSVTSSTGNTTICSGQSIMLIASGATSYSWSPGGATTASITVSPSVSTSYTVTGMVNSSPQSQSITVIVDTLPIPAFTASISGMDVSFSSQSQNAVTLTWKFGDGSAQISSATPVHIYTTAGIYTVLLITSNGCGADTLSKEINVGVNGINNTVPDDMIRLYQISTGEIKVIYPDQYAMDKNIYIYSITGEKLATLVEDSNQNSALVNIGYLSSGLYLLKVGSTIRKVVR